MLFVNNIFQKVHRFVYVNNIKVYNNLTSYYIIKDKKCADSSEIII